MLNNNYVIHSITTFVKQKLQNDHSGHDWWHIHRVHQLSKHIANIEGVDLKVVEIAALLHDVVDWKIIDDESKGVEEIRNLLIDLNFYSNDIEHIVEIITTLSYKGAGVETPMKTIEGKIVQDADRLDAIGAMGIARAFAYGGNKHREMYNPEVESTMHDSFEEYKASNSTTINHFYEKLLLLKYRMNTITAKTMADERHKVMEEFLSRFYLEWNGDA